MIESRMTEPQPPTVNINGEIKPGEVIHQSELKVGEVVKNSTLERTPEGSGFAPTVSNIGEGFKPVAGEASQPKTDTTQPDTNVNPPNQTGGLRQ